MNILIPFILLLNSFYPSTIPKDELTSFYPSTIHNEANSLKHKYKGTWNNNNIYITINYAKFNNSISYSGKLSGFTQFKNNTCSIKGTFKLTGKGTYTVNFYENSDESYCNGSFSGTIISYNDGAVFEGEIITRGKHTPKQEYLKLTSVD